MERMERLERSRRRARLEVTCRRFAVLSGTRQEADDYTTCVQAKPGSRKGTLALLTEPAGDHPSLSVEACKLAQKIITDQYVADNSLSLTSGFLGALDAANSAVLRFNYASVPDYTSEEAGSPVPVQTGGSRAGRFKVGLTAAMLRADGTGIYLAQMAPAQAYIRHNGLVSPIPETPGWRSHGRPAKNRPPLSLVRNDEEQELFTETGEAMDIAPDYTQENLLAPALGTDPGIESDLIYRRVEEGDLIVLVSSGLARLLGRDTAENIFSIDDADAVSDALFDLAMSNGVAQAHACVLMLGGELSPELEAHWSEPPSVTVVPDMPEIPEEEGYKVGTTESVIQEPEEAAPGRLAGLRGTLLAPKTWLNARKQQSTEYSLEEMQTANEEDATETIFDVEQTQKPLPLHQHVHVQVHKDTSPVIEHETTDEGAHADRVELVAGADAQAQSEARPTVSQAEPEQSIYGTRTLLQRTVYTPAYKAPVLWSEDEEAENAPFDGWEDKPPILTYSDAEDEESSEPKVFPWEKESRIRPFQASQAIPVQDMAARKNYPAPQLFTGPTTPSQPFTASVTRPSRAHPGVMIAKRLPAQLNRLGRGAATWIGSAAHNMLPERQLFRPRRALNRLQGTAGGRTISIQVLTGIALLAVLALLAWSVLRAVSSGKESAINALLQQSKQEDLLSNQPSTGDVERVKTLTSALEHAKQAVVADPRSNEAKLLVGKVQAELDKAQGITRLTGVSPLFDLSQPGGTFASAPTTKAGATIPTTGTLQLSDIIVMSNDAYILDRAHGKIYRCNISAKNCAPALSTGDTAAGQKVGKPVAITVRVGNLVAVDDKLSSYVYSPDTSAWQAEQLGDADKLQKPLGIATYDGNLYLLGAKSGQISKYPVGKYGSAPEDWIQEQASIDQMKNPVALAIDGSIYVLLSDDKILVMQGGKMARTITPKPSPSVTAPSDLFTSTDTRDIYVLRATDGTITRISKEGQTLDTFKAPATEDKLATLNGMTVDEGRGKFYLISGQKVYEANLPGHDAQAAVDAPASAPQQPANASQQPTVRPTAEP